MKTKTLEHWKGILGIVVATVTPFGVWATGESSLRGAVAGGLIGGLAALYNWVDNTLEEAKLRKARKRLDDSVSEMDIDVSSVPKMKLKLDKAAASVTTDVACAKLEDEVKP